MQMDASMRDLGVQIEDMGRELSNGQAEQRTLENSEMIVVMGMEKSFIKMVQNILANGVTIKEMVRGNSYG